jgi:ABC-type multidrug transport system fused ATPase/permease subunit
VQTVQAYTHEALSRADFAVTEKSFDAARRRIWTRAAMTVIVIFLVFAGIVGVLWIGARDVRAGDMSTGLLIQFLIYAIMVGGAVAALSEIFSELQRAAGATERLVELLNRPTTRSEDPDQPKPPARAGAGRDRLRGRRHFAYPGAARNTRRWTVSAFKIASGRDRGARRPVGRRQDNDCNCSSASTIPGRADPLDGVAPDARWTGTISAATSRWCRRTR